MNGEPSDGPADVIAPRPDLKPTDLEIIAGTMIGFAEPVKPLPSSRETPRQALEGVLLPALQRGRCCILFSGGRDSSVLLAIACHVARREGLPDPVPVTYRYPGDALAEEGDWQELVVRHLGVEDWVKVEITTEHEVLGSTARDALLRHGLAIPPNWWLRRLPQAVGGRPIPGPEPTRSTTPLTPVTVVNGVGGDEVGSPPPRPLLDGLRRRSIRPLRHPRQLAREFSWGMRRWQDFGPFWRENLPWIRPERLEDVVEQIVRASPYQPYNYGPAIGELPSMRLMQASHDLDRVATAETGARSLSPFLETRVLAALGQRYGALFPRSRTELVAELSADLLPDAVIARNSKATADTAFYGRETREWLEGWDGSSPYDDLVDGREARAMLLRTSRGRDGHVGPTSIAQAALLAQLR